MVTAIQKAVNIDLSTGVFAEDKEFFLPINKRIFNRFTVHKYCKAMQLCTSKSGHIISFIIYIILASLYRG